MIKGVFFLEPIEENIVNEIIEAGVNEISLKWEYYNQELVDLLRKNNIRVYAEVSLFVHEELWQKYPDSRPVDRSGKPIDAINWYHGVCPNHPGVRAEKLSIIDHVIESFSIDGLWLDFIRYPCHWEEIRSSQITEYCFCENCLTKYEEEVGGLPEGEDWISWKCQQIADFVENVRNRIEASGKTLQLGMFAVPWTEDAYGNAIRSIVCQDFRSLSKHIDLFGVMTYHRLTEQPLEWISYVAEKTAQITGKPVVPLIQSIDIPVTISGEEFRKSIEVAVGKPSKGVIVFHFHDLLENMSKYKIMKNKFRTL